MAHKTTTAYVILNLYLSPPYPTSISQHLEPKQQCQVKRILVQIEVIAPDVNESSFSPACMVLHNNNNPSPRRCLIERKVINCINFQLFISQVLWDGMRCAWEVNSASHWKMSLWRKRHGVSRESLCGGVLLAFGYTYILGHTWKHSPLALYATLGFSYS